MLTHLKGQEDADQDYEAAIDHNFMDDRDDIYSSMGQSYHSAISSQSKQYTELNGLSNRERVTSKSRNNRSVFTELSKTKDSESQKEYVSLTQVQINPDLMESHHDHEYDHDHKSCWGCDNGVLAASTIGTKFTGFKEIANLIKTEINNSTIDSLVKRIKQIYDSKLKYQISELTGEQPEEWEMKDIKYHLRLCRADPIINKKFKVEDWEKIYLIAASNAIYKNENSPSGYSINSEEMKKMAYAGDQVLKYLTHNVDKAPTLSTFTTPTEILQKRDKTPHLNKKTNQL